MATNDELRKQQRELLFDLLMLEKANRGIEVKLLPDQIVRAKASMQAEDISHIETLINSR